MPDLSICSNLENLLLNFPPYSRLAAGALVPKVGYNYPKIDFIWTLWVAFYISSMRSGNVDVLAPL
jgi:hypothetical protein